MKNQIPYGAKVDYNEILATSIGSSFEEIFAWMSEEFPYAWRDAYLSMSPRQVNICRIELGPFEYIYDDSATLAANERELNDPETEARLVAAFGRSTPRERSERTREDYRLKGWVGPTQAFFGKRWDKGHFIAHSSGGAVDRAEVNVFVQRRDLNRGWSEEGKRFRAMEKYCFLNPGTFCFNMPLYIDGSAKPAFIEFGVLRLRKNFGWSASTTVRKTERPDFPEGGVNFRVDPSTSPFFIS